ncbi:MAG: glycoside hydrolase family 3 N-terminal domain-containing protein [Planctomycetota bacterium]
MEGLKELVAAVLCPRFPAAETGLDFGDGASRPLPGGFCLFRRELPGALERIADLRSSAGHSGGGPYVCSDLERGAGQQVEGLTRLPPPLALGATGSADLARRAGSLTAREALSAGIAVIFAPVLDLADEPENPIVAARAFGADPAEVSRLGSAWIQGCVAGGALPVAKHYPGHGATLVDSHLVLPVLQKTAEQLQEREERPFRAAISAGVPGIMMGHLHVPGLGDRAALAASLSANVMRRRLRGKLRFSGTIFTDALNMRSITEGLASPEAARDPAVRALLAGADVALMPEDANRSARALVEAVSTGLLPRERLAESVERIRAMLATVAARCGRAPEPDPAGPALALEIARGSVVRTLGKDGLPPAQLHDSDVSLFPVVDSEDDSALGPLIEELRSNSLRPRLNDASPDLPGLVVVLSDVRAWKGRVRLEESRLLEIQRLLAGPGRRLLLSIGPPQAVGPLPGAGYAVFDNDPASLKAAAEAVCGKLAPNGSVCW